MNDQTAENLAQRVDKLEQTVADLERRISGASAPQASQRVDDTHGQKISTASSQVEKTPPLERKQAIPPRSVPKLPSASFELPEVMRHGEYWFNKVGIGLLLFGVAFLFKYSVDQGWITPPIKVGLGMSIGVALAVVGMRMHRHRRDFSQVLLGGSIAVFYICGFAGFQLYAMVSHATAMALMVLVTVGAFVLALLQNQAILSLIGILGGLATPFLLHRGNGSITSLVLYICVLLVGASGVYFYRGWRSLLWSCVVGGWVILLKLLPQGVGWAAFSISDRWALQFGVFFCWLAFGLLPTAREVACTEWPLRWLRPSFGWAEKMFAPGGIKVLARHVHLPTVSTPLIALLFSQAIWPVPSNQTWGWIALAFSGFYAATACTLKRWEQVRDLQATHGLVAVMLLTTALCLLLAAEFRLFTLATEAVVLHILSRRLAEVSMRVYAHLLCAGLGIWLLFRIGLAGGGESVGLLSAPALTELWVIAMALGVARVSVGRGRVVYLLAAHAVVTAWFIRELDGSTLFAVLTAEAVVLRLLATWMNDKAVNLVSHLFFGALAFWLSERLLPGGTQTEVVTPILSGKALANAWMAAVALGASFLVVSSEARIVYRIGSHLAILGWFLRELSAFPSGQAYVTIAWGIYALTLLVTGLRTNRSELSATAIATLLMVVGKLFLVDLVKVEAIWRILLFVGFGGGFLAISFYYRRLWKGKTGANTLTEPPRVVDTRLDQ